MNPYSNFSSADLILRDVLAIERTALANERTLLSYLRTGMALLIAGVTGSHYFSEERWVVLSIIGAAAGVAIVILGIIRFLVVWKRLAGLWPKKNS